jgi:transposase
LDRKTVRKYLDRGLEVPVYGPREPRPRLLEPYEGYLSEKIRNCPGLSGRRLFREITALGYTGGYSAVTDYLRSIRPELPRVFERRFETEPGQQARADFAAFSVAFTDAPGIMRKVWLFSFVRGHSRWLWGRFCANQKLETVLRCHVAAFAACGGATSEVLYDRMKTAVLGEDAAGIVVYNPSLVAMLDHDGSAPKACKAYRGSDSVRHGSGRPPGEHVGRRSLAFYDTVAQRLAAQEVRRFVRFWTVSVALWWACACRVRWKRLITPCSNWNRATCLASRRWMSF